MSLHQDEKYILPSTLEPKQDDHSTLGNMITETEPLKSMFIILMTFKFLLINLIK